MRSNVVAWPVGSIINRNRLNRFNLIALLAVKLTSENRVFSARAVVKFMACSIDSANSKADATKSPEDIHA
jgi:hypothetical protein